VKNLGATEVVIKPATADALLASIAAACPEAATAERDA
jgi:hypothetical protein